MSAYFFLPFYFLSFWFGEAPLSILRSFMEINKAFFRFFSISLLLRTFFQPIKSEYRKGLVGFSIGMGIVVKTIVILVSLVLFIPILLLELLLLGGFLTFPLVTVALLIW
jgi:hypothetical protein